MTAAAPPAPGTVLVAPADEARVVAVLARRRGVPAADADLLAASLVHADLRGHPSHGLRRLPVLLERLDRGLIQPVPRPMVVCDAGATVLLDGNAGLGPVVGRQAMELAVLRAQSYGVAAVGVRNAGHLGALSFYVEPPAHDGLVALATTTSEALVHAPGGRGPVIGTNPLAAGLPTGAEPLVFDMATGVVSMGRILDHAERGEPIPAGWAIDADGEPTTDPSAAVHGAIAPFGGAKGYGLSLVLEVLVGLMTATALGTDVTGTLDTQSRCTKGDLFVAFSPERLGLDAGLERIAAYLDDVRATGPGVAVPGDGARERVAAAREHGVALQRELWDRLRAEAEGGGA